MISSNESFLLTRQKIIVKSYHATRRPKLLSRLRRHGSDVGSRDSDSPAVILSVSQQRAMRLLLTFDSWDCKLPPLPTRSRLYALEPIGIGTPFVESLSGYVARLADAHAVSVGDLAGRELSALTSKPLLSFGPFMRRNRADSHGFHAQQYTMNGLGITSKKWVEALERATLRADLRFLTLLPFEGVLSCVAAFRCTRAWCPACYDDWRSGGDVVYEPLLWAIEPVTVCPRHRRPLEKACRHCHGRRVFSANLRDSG